MSHCRTSAKRQRKILTDWWQSQRKVKLIMENKLKIEGRKVYGQVPYYPINDTAKQFLNIQGGKCLSVSTIRAAQALGFGVEVLAAEVYQPLMPF